MPKRKTDSQEMLQLGYLFAVSAAAGCNTWQPQIDEGVDVLLSHTSAAHLSNQAWLHIQMKATGASGSKQASRISAKMSRKRYNELRDPNVTFNKIVVIMHQPTSQAKWISAGQQNLVIRHCAYWVSLRGLPEPPGSGDYVTVTAPLSNVFDDVELCRLMAIVGQGGVL